MQKVCFGSVLGYILEAKSIKKRVKIDSEKNIGKNIEQTPQNGGIHETPPISIFIAKSSRCELSYRSLITLVRSLKGPPRIGTLRGSARGSKGNYSKKCGV